MSSDVCTRRPTRSTPQREGRASEVVQRLEGVVGGDGGGVVARRVSLPAV